MQLKHPHHRTFHRDPIPEHMDRDFTRFYRWHIDAALYNLYPPKVTTLLAVKVPNGRRQTLLYDDGSREKMEVPLGTTAFVSGEQMYDRLSKEEKEFAQTSRVEYAPHPYVVLHSVCEWAMLTGAATSGWALPAPSPTL